LAVVLTELLQNAVDHGFGDDPVEPGFVAIELKNDGDELIVEVHDNGRGPPAGFTLEGSGGLGLTIVRALVTSELDGTIDMRSDRGTTVELRIPVKLPPTPVV